MRSPFLSGHFHRGFWLTCITGEMEVKLMWISEKFGAVCFITAKEALVKLEKGATGHFVKQDFGSHSWYCLVFIQ